ncbi:MAG: hypothetical protein RBU37_18950 [Myxococcota bacterium]|jgi:type II secretion system protein C|nr:hypothetical protein [Myxococcota bacterium]
MSRRSAVQVGLLFAQLFCVMLMALFGALGVNAWLSELLVDAMPSSALQLAASPPSTAEAAPVGVNELLFARDLFNRDAAIETAAPTLAPELTMSTSPDAQAKQSAKPSELPLRLMGTMVSSDTRFSRAQLQMLDSGEDLSARIGDRLGPVVLVGIARSYVTLRRLDGNGLELLNLQGTSVAQPTVASAAGNANAPDASQPGNEQALSEPQESVPESALAVRRIADDQYVIPRSLAAEQARNRATLAVQTRTGAYIANGAMQGYRLNDIAEDSFLSQLGLMSGDVILSINGQKPGSEEGSLQFLDLVQSGEVTVEIDRRGQNRQLRIQPE